MLNISTMTRSMNYGVSRARIGSQPLSDDDIMSVAPSVFADKPHESRSSRYVYVDTRALLAEYRSNGWQVVRAQQSKSRIPGKSEFTKHMLRFRHESATSLQVNGTLPEVVLLNAHDGTSSYQLWSGLFRLVCLNGCVVPMGEHEAVRVHHTGKAIPEIIDGSFRVLEHSKRALAAPEQWSRIQLNDTERLALAESARVVRLGDADGKVDSPIQASQFLSTRRHEDAGRDLWTTFNVLQENAIRGGLHGRMPRDERGNRGRRVSTREVNGIDQDVKLNKALWMLAESMAKLKAA